MMLRCWGYVIHECGKALLVVLNKSLTSGQGKDILLVVLTSVLHMAQLSFFSQQVIEKTLECY